MGTTIDKCRTCKHAFTTGKDRWYCKKSLADKDDCGEYEMTIELPCGEQMDFPNTFDEFAEDYGFKDKDKIYTNGSELIPVFRVKQWLEHIKSSTTNTELHSVTPQESNADMLGEIRTEIEQISNEEQKHDEKWAIGLRYAVKIIDKYKAEVR